MKLRPILPVLAIYLCLCGAAVASEYTETEIAAFLGADENRDLVLDRTEFRTFIVTMAKAGHMTSKTVFTFRAYGHAFRVTDKNRDGVVTPEELHSADRDFQASN